MPDYFSLGYVLTRPVPTANLGSIELLPTEILTFSECVAEFLPSVWGIRWCNVKESDRRTSAAHFGVPAADIDALLDSTTAAHAAEDHLWPNTFVTLQAARSFAQRFGRGSPDVALLGLGLLGESRINLLHDLVIPEGIGDPATLVLLKRGEMLEAGGDFLGFEMLGAEDSGQYHSWLCNALVDDVERELSISPNEYGLITDAADALRAADYCGSDEVGAEPVPWFCGAMVKYPF